MSSEKVEGTRKKTGGRKAGVPNKKTAAMVQAIEASGLTPLEYMLSVMRDEGATRQERMNAASAAAPYVHAKLASVEHKGPDGGPIQFTQITRKIVKPEKP